MSANSTSSVSSRDALSLYDNMVRLQETAREYKVSLDVQVNAAKILLRDNPRETYANADADRREKLTSHLEKLTKMSLEILGPKEIEFYSSEFNRRVEHFTENILDGLKSEVERIKKQALDIFANQSTRSFDEVWNTYDQSIPYIIGAANLVSRQIAFSNIVVSAKHKEEARGSSQEQVDALLARAKTALKLDDPKALIPTDEISRIESQYLEDASRL